MASGSSQIDKTARSAGLILPPGPSKAHTIIQVYLCSAEVAFASIERLEANLR